MNSRILVVLLAATLLATSAAIAADKPASKSSSPKPLVVTPPTGGSVVPVTGATTLGAGAEMVMCTVNNASYTVTLPPASALGQRITVMITSYTPFGQVNFAGQGSDVIIDGVWGAVNPTISTISALGSSVEFVSDGNGKWFPTWSNGFYSLTTPKPPAGAGNPSAK